MVTAYSRPQRPKSDSTESSKNQINQDVIFSYAEAERKLYRQFLNSVANSDSEISTTDSELTDFEDDSSCNTDSNDLITTAKERRWMRHNISNSGSESQSVVPGDSVFVPGVQLYKDSESDSEPESDRNHESESDVSNTNVVQHLLDFFSPECSESDNPDNDFGLIELDNLIEKGLREMVRIMPLSEDSSIRKGLEEMINTGILSNHGSRLDEDLKKRDSTSSSFPRVPLTLRSQKSNTRDKKNKNLNNKRFQNFAKQKHRRFQELGLIEDLFKPYLDRESISPEEADQAYREFLEKEVGSKEGLGPGCREVRRTSDIDSYCHDLDPIEIDMTIDEEEDFELDGTTKSESSKKTKSNSDTDSNITDKNDLFITRYCNRFLAPALLTCTTLLYASYLFPPTLAMGSTAAAKFTAPGIFGGVPLYHMMMPPLIGEVPAMARSGTTPNILDVLFPKYDSNTFLGRVSALQITEYIGSCFLTMGSIAQKDTLQTAMVGSSVVVTPNMCALYLLGASWGPAIASGGVWRLISPAMLHANFLHIFFNLFFQSRIGYQIEKQLGPRRFMLVYLFCGLSGNLISLVRDPLKLAIGASTSAFGLLGVWLAEVHLTWHLMRTPSKNRLVLWLGGILSAFWIMSKLAPMLDGWGHLGGLAGGYLLSMSMASMSPEHRPEWYSHGKAWSRTIIAWTVGVGLMKTLFLNPTMPLPNCGTLLHPKTDMMVQF